MKKFYSFVLLAATLLLSTNIWAANSGTASLNGATAQPIADAISAWATNGGTLTLASDCEFNATATTIVAQQNSVLDLAGHTLTWKVEGLAINALTISGGSLTIQDSKAGSSTQDGKLSFLFSGVPKKVTNVGGGIFQESGECNISGATIECSVEAASTVTGDVLIGAIYVNDGSLNVENGTILMKKSCAHAIRLEGYNVETSFAGVSIQYEKSENQQPSYESNYSGIYTKAKSLTLDAKTNVQIDLSQAPTLKATNKPTAHYAINLAGGTATATATKTVISRSLKIRPIHIAAI